MSGVDYRIAIGLWLSARLERNPAAFRIPSNELDIFLVPDFLTPDECAALIGRIEGNRVPSTLLSPSGDPDYRTSESCNLDPADPFVAGIEAKITGLMGIQAPLGETIQGQRYAVGQQFKPHHDFFFTAADYWPEMERTGGQRTWTAMVFLNQPEGGGETFFEKAGVKVTPRAGNLLAWNNLDAAGEPNYASEHQGMPVTAGRKYIVTKWYRERPWHPASIQVY